MALFSIHLMSPGCGLQCPQAVRIFFLELSRHLAQHRMIVRCFVVAHAFPVESFGRHFRVRIPIEYLRVSAFCISPFFAHERNARETHFQVRTEFIGRQVALDTMPFNSVRIEYEHGRCPQCVEPVEVGRVFFDVRFEWDEVLVDERRGLIVAVRLGFQPSTCASSRRRAEVDEQGFVVGFCFRECRVSVCHPIYFHSCPPKPSHCAAKATKKHSKHNDLYCALAPHGLSLTEFQHFRSSASPSAGPAAHQNLQPPMCCRL